MLKPPDLALSRGLAEKWVNFSGNLTWGHVSGPIRSKRRRKVESRQHMPEKSREGSIAASAARRVFAVSDIHSDYAANLKWALSVDQKAHRQAVLRRLNEI